MNTETDTVWNRRIVSAHRNLDRVAGPGLRDEVIRQTAILWDLPLGSALIMVKHQLVEDVENARR